MRKPSNHNEIDTVAALKFSAAIPATSHNIAPSPSEPDLADDLLQGAAAIAEYMKIDLRRAFYLLKREYIPAVKTGATWTTTKSRLRRHFNGQAG